MGLDREATSAIVVTSYSIRHSYKATAALILRSCGSTFVPDAVPVEATRMYVDGFLMRTDRKLEPICGSKTQKVSHSLLYEARGSLRVVQLCSFPGQAGFVF